MRATEGLKYIFQTVQDVYILSSSGSGAMEAAVVNILSPGEKGLVINTGKFGDRWTKICRAYGVNVIEVVRPWGEDFAPAELAEQLASHPDTRAVFATLSETSTGTVFDLEEYGRLTRERDTLLVVDGISGVGAMPCPMDAWGIDVLIAGSQKSFMSPPGLAFIAFSPKAWKSVVNARLPKFYFDAQASRSSLLKKTSPWTPAISLIRQLDRALAIMREIGLEGLFAHHKIMADATRGGVRTLRLELLSKRPGNVLTAVKTPQGFDGARIVRIMQDKYKTHVAGAQEPHKGEFFRIGHLGFIGGFDIMTALAALEMTLDECGFDFNRGDALGAAEAIIKEHWQ
jgi:aspartate aminotransferase-like enzyme